MEMIIRKETSADYDRVIEITEMAFKTMPFADGDEHELVRRLRKGKYFIPELSLVAESNGLVIGHILFTPVIIKSNAGVFPSLSLAPVSVHPDYQNNGVGSSLIAEGHRIARILGFKSVIVIGHPEYYPRFGYKKASTCGLKVMFDVPEEAFMALELEENGLYGISGTVIFPDEFGLEGT
jgi:predicted N-acetyltransferase YhbS